MNVPDADRLNTAELSALAETHDRMAGRCTDPDGPCGLHAWSANLADALRVQLAERRIRHAWHVDPLGFDIDGRLAPDPD